MIISNYVKTIKTRKSAMIWNYVKIIEVYRSVYSILKFSHTCNYTPNNCDKIT